MLNELINELEVQGSIVGMGTSTWVLLVDVII